MTNRKEIKKDDSEIEECYDDRTKLLLELRAESERQFDKQIVYLSGGALVFSIGFVKDIIGNNVPLYKWMLIGSWICFSISLIFNLFSYLSSRKAIDREIIGRMCSSSIYNKVTIVLNWISIVSLLVGLTFVIVFAIKNF